MAEYKCISCGEIKESEKICSCPKCGYKMFPAPYDRGEILRKEIVDFIAHLKLSKVSPDSFVVFRLVPRKQSSTDGDVTFDAVPKMKDDQRFPDFGKIQGYVCSAARTEGFYERMTESIAQIRKHIQESYFQNYQVTTASVTTETEALDTVLKQALPLVGVSVDLPEIVLPELKLDYSETPDDELLPIAEKLLDDLSALAEKIRKFIKQNNIYGTVYQFKPKKVYKTIDGVDNAKALTDCGATLSKVLSKHYVVDILSDGTDELNEMLRTLWKTVEAIMTFPVLRKRSTFIMQDGTAVAWNDIERTLLERVRCRYAQLDEAIYAYDFLADKTEEELFEIYDKMIKLDSFGFMGVNKHRLLKIGESEKKLSELIGLNGIKDSIKKIKAYALANKGSENLNIHMCFLGNPGSGKTEVARNIAGILYENKILPTKKIVEVDRSGLVSQYFGATAEKTKQVIHSAMGGVLFVDEAYALGNNADTVGNTDYGKEAIDTLVKAMEDYRGKFCVIFAGYKNEMLQMLSTNPGLKSRIQFTLDFPNYSRDELKSITELMLEKRGYTIGSGAMNRILDITDIKRKDPNFANAREIRNILDQVIMCQNLRCAGTDDKELGIVDVNQYIRDAKINLPTTGDGLQNAILTGEEELDQLIGLAPVKRMIKKIKAYAKKNKGQADFNFHMCFYGNPGTGKTEVARILSRILYDAGVLDEAKLVETDGQGLLGKFVGETAPKTEAKINDAMNGVLFIDEAYSLTGNHTAGGVANFGDEAIAVLLKEMEDHRGQFCVILAGYKNEMKEMLSANPGFISRIQFTLEFPDYTREELGEIASVFLKKKKYSIDNDAMERLLDVTEYYRNRPDFANARTVRNIIDQVIMNQNLRTEDTEDDDVIMIEDVDDYITDEGIDLTSSAPERKIGF